jgi:hypothetical protein
VPFIAYVTSWSSAASYIITLAPLFRRQQSTSSSPRPLPWLKRCRPSLLPKAPAAADSLPPITVLIAPILQCPLLPLFLVPNSPFRRSGDLPLFFASPFFLPELAKPAHCPCPSVVASQSYSQDSALVVACQEDALVALLSELASLPVSRTR